ncbi:geranylgeranylglycerol-phosphate geranylgeranyltransferase [Carboxylicivirga caseinilyticus]|uniref:geranylgeranylglycerol-phosphate geranylgeranyltransferase n=1 Tax=Carboxylicivirga caseinilyticus TaxID=3417572 RepID=UPI003D3598F4|nr:geranylgeranylglycerol-phosphate geranylgeranyltransferase [Marinilabiliaceae bacterium A049]
MAYLRLIRYKNLIIIALLQILLRYGLILPILDSFKISPVLSDFRFILVVISTVLLAASGYIINDYFDIRIDRINRPDSVVVGKKISRRSTLFLHVLVTITGMLIGLFISYVTRKENYALFFIGIPVILWYYSTTFKRHILIGNLIIAMFTAIVALLVVSVEFAALARVNGPQILETEACSTAWFWTGGFAFFAFITNLVREIIKDAEDIKGDKAVGCKTLPLAMGMKLTKLFVLLLEITSLAILWLIYFLIPEITHIPYAFVYFIVGFTIPHLLLIYFWMKASESKHFHGVSVLGKIIMLSGILFILLAGQAF